MYNRPKEPGGRLAGIKNQVAGMLGATELVVSYTWQVGKYLEYYSSNPSPNNYKELSKIIIISKLYGTKSK